MGVLTQVVERDGALAGLQRMFGAAGGELLFTESDHGAKGEFLQPRAFAREPFAPALFADGHVVDQLAPIEIGCRTQRIAAALTDQGLEPADVASDDRSIEPYHLAVALQRVRAEHFA